MNPMDFDTIAGILARWGLRPARLRPDIDIAGSPERSLSRDAVEDADGIRALVDWEFCGPKPEAYDAALLVGCLGMEYPQYLIGDLVLGLTARLRGDAGYAERSWASFFDLVLALRFAWLSDWLRRGDAEMIDLEATYIGLLHENRAVFRRSWGLPEASLP